MLTKSELSDKLIELLLAEMPIEMLTMGTPEQSKEYIDVLTDAMTAVTARMVVAYIGKTVASGSQLNEDEMIQIGETVHQRLADHIEYEANDLMLKLYGKNLPDA